MKQQPVENEAGSPDRQEMLHTAQAESFIWKSGRGKLMDGASRELAEPDNRQKRGTAQAGRRGGRGKQEDKIPINWISIVGWITGYWVRRKLELALWLNWRTQNRAEAG
jgi:hypothetical protein